MFNYMNDGADKQSRAVLAYLDRWDGLENSWSDEAKRYCARPSIARWSNGREQGYIITLVSPLRSDQLNIAFFEHRNSDSIHAIRWTQELTTNAPTISTANFGDVYKDKYDTSFSASWGNVLEMADWIYDQMEEYWEKTNEL